MSLILFQIAREHGIPFLETSAKANINVEKAFMDLAQAILNKVFFLVFTVFFKAKDVV